MQTTWNIKKYNKEDIDKIKEKYGITDILSKLLLSKNIEFAKIDKFLNGTTDDLSSPYDLKDMDKFVERIDDAIKNNEKICIYGDYDTDGVTSVTVLYKFLTSLGADVMYYVPDRLIEGYGINKEALDEINRNGARVIITVDCGITAIDEVEYANALGIDVCITDHHECKDTLPNAICVVDPKRKDDSSDLKMLAGVGVAFKCISALCIKRKLDKEEYLKYLDIVAVGTISDIVLLIGENRIISKYGIKMMKDTKNLGLKELIKITKAKEIDSMMVSFGLAPRINASGRMGNAAAAIRLFLETDENMAKKIATELDELNNERKKVETEIFNEALEKIKNEGLDKRNSIVLYNPSWHSGVIGIVASKIVSMYYRPVILLTKEQGVIRGSGRCPNGFSLYDALDNSKEYLTQFGGHALAAGLTIEEENIELFRNKFEEVVTNMGIESIEQVIDIDCEVTTKDLNSQLIKDIRTMKPYGQSNSEPVFIYKNVKIHSIRTLKEDKHLKLVLSDGKYLVEAVGFSLGNRRDEIKIGDRVDVVGNIELNSFNTPKTIQIVIKDFKKSV